MPPKRKRAVPVNNGSDVEEATVRQAATKVGFYDPNIDSKLYTFWRAQVQLTGHVGDHIPCPRSTQGIKPCGLEDNGAR